MPKIVRLHATGDADVLKVEDWPLAEPAYYMDSNRQKGKIVVTV